MVRVQSPVDVIDSKRIVIGMVVPGAQGCARISSMV
jgi:hypothetical protein